MTYQTFISNIKDYLDQYYGNDAEIRINSIQKNNGVNLDGISIMEHNSNITPTIYLHQFYEEMNENDLSIENIAKQIISLHDKHNKIKHLSMDFFTDITKIHSHIFFKVINYSLNKDLLQDVPYIPYLDLALVFYATIDSIDESLGTILIRNSHLTNWGIKQNELYAMAMENTIKKMPEEYLLMDDFIENFISKKDLPFVKEMPDPKGPSLTGRRMYIISNNSRLFGASIMCYPGMLESFCERLDSSYYLIPSSIHEIIIVPANDKEEIETYNAMVKEVNENSLDTEDILSDHVYYFDKTKNTLLAG